MKIKTYVFDDMKEGMKKIKEEHGVDTIIVDIKNNSTAASGKGCEISVAVEGDRAVQGDDLEGLRRQMEAVWDQNIRYTAGKVNNMETEMMRDRVKSYPLPLRAVFDKMVKNGFEAQSAISIVSEVYCSLGPLAEDSPKAGFFVKRMISSRIRVHNPILSSAPILILGPSGAGKTETAKKLARLSVDHALNVSVIAAAPVSRGANAGLRSFAENRGIPFASVSNEHDLIQGLEAGNTRKIVDLSGPLDAQKKMVSRLINVEKLLVLPAGLRDQRMKACCDQLKGQNITGLVFTKLDEEETVGHIFDNLLRLGLPLSFLTMGSGEKDIVTPNTDVLYKILIEGNTWKRRESVLLQ